MSRIYREDAPCYVVTPLPLPQALKGKKRWGEGVRPCVGRAVFCEAAMKVGVWEPDRLDLVLRKAAGGTHPTKGTMRNLRNGHGPSWITVSSVEQGRPDIDAIYWGNHPIFHMLDCTEHDTRFGAVMTYAVDSVWGRVRERFWPWAHSGSEPGSGNPNIEIIQDTGVIEEAFSDPHFSEMRAHDRFVFAMACYFIAKRNRKPKIARRAADVTRQEFMFAAMNQPQLLVSWRTLQEEVAKKIWDVEGIGGRLGPIFTVQGGITEKFLREWFPEQVLAMAEANEAEALSREATKTLDTVRG